MVRYAPVRRAGRAGFYGSLVAAGSRAISNWSNKRRRSQKSSNDDDRVANPSTGTPSTFQNDRINLYVKRRGRGSYRSKRNARKFNSKVKGVIYSTLGTKTLTRTDQGAFTSAINTLTSYAFFVNGANDGIYADLRQCMADFNQLGTALGRSDNLLMQSSSCQLTMANKTGSGTVMYMTLYYFLCRKDMSITDVSVLSKYNSAFSQNTILPSSIGITAGNRTATPFIAGTWCQHFLITKIVRITLADGQQTTIDMRYPKKYTVRNEDIQDNCALKGKTRGVLVVFHGGLSASGDLDPTSLSYQFNRTYVGKHSQDSYNAAGQD